EVLTLDFSKQGYGRNEVMSPLQLGDVTITPYKGDKSQLPDYYPDYTSMVFYWSNYMTLQCATKSISRIEFTTNSLLPFEQHHVLAEDGIVTVKSATEAEWTNNRSVTSLTIRPKFNFTTEGVCIQTMKIYLTERPVATATAATPVILPTDGTIRPNTDITITSETPGATIYYTTDGSTPVPGNASTSVYNSPIHLEKTSIIKAIATADGMQESNIGARGFEVPIEYTCIADLLANAVDGVSYTLNSNMTVTYTKLATCWIKDDSGVIKLYGNNIVHKQPASGSTLSTVTGIFNLDRQTPELDWVDDFFIVPGDAPAEPKEMKATEISAANINEYIIVKNVTLQRTPSDKNNYYMTDESGTIVIRNNYGLEIKESILSESKTVDVYLFPAYYNTEVRLYPVEIYDPNPEPEPEPEPDNHPGNGTYAYPYTIEEALKAQDTETFEQNIWVKGYIVGTFPNPFIGSYGTPTFGVENASDQTLILADSNDCTDFDKCMKLCYLQGNVKTDLNLKNNPEMLGEYVAVCGMMSSYYAALQMASEYELRTPPVSTGIADIDADSNDLPVQYYNLQGQPVNADNLRQGQIYIRRQGGQATKILIK
ncbi:MAG: chitobiase/beta-hexosaminidase C-terminal domain-containing protein, partial [Muribaculaceae bacterium]|nr:chitobiase/beta-hexosaminidase C-terminal domain-containing protein [Muribaculaceae bacterium]